MMASTEILGPWRDVMADAVRADGPDLSMRQWAILLTVYLNPGPHTVRALARDLNVPKPAISVGLNPVQFSESLQNLITTGCDFISLPTRWRDMEPDEGKYAFTPTDRWIEWAVRHSKMPVSAGPVVDLSRSNVPDWLYIWEHDYETLREVVYEHVKNVITR